MLNRAGSSRRNPQRRPWPSSARVIVSAALFFALSGSAVAANSLIRTGDLATDAVTSRVIKNGGVEPRDLSTRTRALLQGAGGLAGVRGDAGPTGVAGNNGPNGANGANGANGPAGVDGSNGADGTNGPNGANGANGVDGTDGTDGVDGTNGSDGADGIDGTIAPLYAKQGLTALPTASPPTTVVELTVPAGDYVILAKTQLSHTGAGDSIDCVLKAGPSAIDQVSMKTLPALAAVPVSLQAVLGTISASQVNLECDVQVANGSAAFSSLIAIPTG